MRGDQLARQWQLIQHLASSRVGVGIDTLIEELGCVRRTVYRDLEALMYAGFPVTSEKRDGRVFYRFVDRFHMGDVPFTPDELLAIAFGADLLRPLEGTVFHDSVQSALAKIRAGLGPELTDYLERLAETFRVLPGPHKRYAEYRETIEVLNQGLLAQRSVNMHYRTGSTGTLRERMLDPYRIWYRSGGLYVIGHDHRSGEIRTFAIDRIERISATEERFEIVPGFDFDAYTGSSFGVFSEPATHVVIRFEPNWRTHVQERTWHASQRLRECGDGRVELHMDVGGTAELCSWVLSFGTGAEVLEPAELRDQVRGELEGARARYEGPLGSTPSGK